MDRCTASRSCTQLPGTWCAACTTCTPSSFPQRRYPELQASPLTAEWATAWQAAEGPESLLHLQQLQPGSALQLGHLLHGLSMPLLVQSLSDLCPQRSGAATLTTTSSRSPAVPRRPPTCPQPASPGSLCPSALPAAICGSGCSLPIVLCACISAVCWAQFRRALRRPQRAEREYLAAQYTGTGLKVGPASPLGGYMVAGAASLDHTGVMGADRVRELDPTDLRLCSIGTPLHVGECRLRLPPGFLMHGQDPFQFKPCAPVSCAAGPLAESPAEEAGVLAGERLLEISEPRPMSVQAWLLLLLPRLSLAHSCVLPSIS